MMVSRWIDDQCVDGCHSRMHRGLRDVEIVMYNGFPSTQKGKLSYTTLFSIKTHFSPPFHHAFNALVLLS